MGECSSVGRCVESEESSKMELGLMDPLKIRYSQSSISRFFRTPVRKDDGGQALYSDVLRAPSKTVEGLFNDLLIGNVKAEDIPAISIVNHRNVWYSLDNRRLWAFKCYAKVVPGKLVPVHIATDEEKMKDFFKKLDGRFDGESVTFHDAESVAQFAEKKTLPHEVLKWSLANIRNDGLLANQVAPIPLKFDSLKKYLASFTLPLIEEVRAVLKQCLENIADAQRADIHRREEVDLKNAEGSFRSFKFCLCDEREATSSDVPCQKRSSFRPMDIILLTTVVPTCVEDLETPGQHYTLALLKSGSFEKDREQADFTSEVYAHPESPVYAALLDNERIWYAIRLTSVATYTRIWEALHRPLDPDRIQDENQIFEEVLDVYLGPASQDSEYQSRIKSQCFCWFNLNDSQAEALSSTVASLKLKEPPYVRLIQGPPGTGKTSVLVSMISYLSSMGKRVLVCAPTNTAISEILYRFLKEVKRGKPLIPGGRIVRTGDIVLLGNEDGLDVTGELSEVFLPHRVVRLATALGAACGWYQRVLSMIDLIRNAVEMFERPNADDVVGDESPIGFFHFIRKRIRLVGEQMVSSIECVCYDMPSRFLKSTGILCADGILHAILKLMEHDVPDTVARSWFEKLGSEGIHERETVPGELRALLKLLEENLHFLNLPNGKQLLDESDLLKFASVVCCTSSSAGKSIVQSSKFSIAIVDEAAQLVEAESTIVMGIQGLKQLVLVGDQQQLPATVISKVSGNCGYGRSVFQRLQELGHSSIMLDIQYRMHPAISKFSSQNFYEGKLKDGPNVMVGQYGAHLHSSLFGPYMFVNVTGSEMRDELNENSHSKMNPLELEILLHVLKKLASNCKASNESIEIGIISPYSAQVQAIENRLGTINLGSAKVEVKSVDGFQGGEKDVILLSTVRSTELGFLKDHRRLNVAITRARACLCIIGNEQTLSSQDGIWRSLVIDAKKRNCFMNSEDESGMKKVIIKFKKEQGQLEDLLKPDSVLFNNTIWKVHFSRDFKINFPKIQKTSKEIILNGLLNLAGGLWKNKRRLLAVPRSIEEDISVYISSNMYTIWSVGIHQDNEYQIIKIWDIVSFENLKPTCERFEKLFSTYTSDYLKRCRTKRVENGIALPVTWKGCNDLVWYKSMRGNLKENTEPLVETTTSGEDSSVSESLVLMKFYPLRSNEARQLLSSDDFELRFEVTKEETEAVKYPHSTFIVGRSGTGKTTVISNRLIRREELASTIDGPYANMKQRGIRQVVITVSSKLCTAIKLYVEKIRRGSSNENQEAENIMLDDETEEKLFSHIPNTFIGLPSQAFPLFLTYRKVLAMLDGSVKTPFNVRRRLEKEAADEEAYDEASDKSEDDLEPETTSNPSGSLLSTEEVSFNRFAAEYWPHMNSAHARKFDASLVFAEFMSCIKGSPESLRSPKGRLTRISYMNMSCKRISCFDESERETIYDLYDQYEKMKSKKGDYDIADYVYHLYHQLERGGFLGGKVDFIYVDEVQDLTLGQISLLKFLTDNIEDGFVFAGDTAQTIAKGVNFRFEDITSLFYTDFLQIESDNWVGKRKPKAPMLHQLTHNFRTHDGIVAIASRVMMLILHFFADTVDKLLPETSIIRGEKPVILEAEDNNMISCLFQIDSKDSKPSECEFGAQQVILVRHSHAKDNLLKQLGKCSLVLTIEECKGLEFQDVLLYNFFTDSCFGKKWRVLYQYLEEKQLPHCPSPKFDKKAHKLLCSELKHLYVALTRCKQRLWMFDELLECQKPMRDCWNAFELIEAKRLDAALISSMHTVSSPEEWRKRGYEVFAEKQYETAMMCFERANDPLLRRLAEAALSQQKAENMVIGATTKQIRRELFKKASELYVSVKKYEAAAKCLKAAEEYTRAGQIYRDQCQPAKLNEAAECFVSAKKYADAAESFWNAKCLQKCLQACQTGKLFEKGLGFIKQWRSTMSEKDSVPMPEADLFLRNAAKMYKDKGEAALMMKFVDAFSSLEAKRQFLRREKLFKQLTNIETLAGNFKEASDAAEGMGDVGMAVNLLEKAGKRGEAALKLFKFVQFQALWGNNNRGWPLRPCEDASLIRKAKVLASQDAKLLHQLKVTSTPSSSPIVLLIENWQLARGDPKIEIIALRQLLDASFSALATQSSPAKLDLHLMNEFLDGDKISSEQNLLQLAVSAWNTWFGLISSMLKALLSVQKMIPSGFNLDWCLEYLGVSRHPIAGLFIVEDIEAFWLQNEILNPLPNQGKRGQIRIQRLLLRAKEFWKGHLNATALECLKALDNYMRCAEGAEHVIVLLKLLDMLDGLLSQELKSTEFLEARVQAYRKEMFRTLFLKTSSGSVEACVLREEPKVQAHLDMLASELVEENALLSTEKVGMLQVLLPFLSRNCMGSLVRIKAEVAKQGEELLEWLKFYNKEPDQHMQLSCLSFNLLGAKSCESLMRVFETDWKRSMDYIRAPTFLYLLERTLVYTSACLRHVTDVILPKSLVIEFMAGKSQEMLYSMVLRAACPSRACLAHVACLQKITDICSYLLTRGSELTDWLARCKMELELPMTVFRLLRILMIIFMDEQHSPEVTSKIFKDLKFLVHEKSPLLDELPKEFQRDFLLVFNRQKATDYDIRQAFKRSMQSVSDPFLMLERADKQRLSRRGFQTVFVERTRWTFKVSSLFQSAVVTDASPKEHVEESSVLNTKLTYQCPTQDELPSEEQENEMPESHVKFGDEKICWFVKRRLLRNLKTLRDQDEYTRDAKRHLGRMVGIHSQYVHNFVVDVCPLKASFDTFLEDLTSAIHVMENSDSSNDTKRDELREAMNDFSDEAAVLSTFLDPSHEGHKKLDEDWLRESVIIPARKLLEDGERKWKSAVMNLLGKSDRIEDSKVPQKSMSKHQLKKQKQQKKRKGKKK